jgi:hypothetical protein
VKIYIIENYTVNHNLINIAANLLLRNKLHGVSVTTYILQPLEHGCHVEMRLK